MNDVERILSDLRAIDAAVGRIRELMPKPEGPEWAFPVGSGKYPPAAWYAATLHDESGKINNGYGHTGIDLNVDRRPWGDVDRGQPVFAVADGVVDAVHYSKSYLGSVIILVEHNGAPLYVRYWHLADDETFRAYQVGQRVKADQCLGKIGNYRLGRGGDHLHFDMALDPFGPAWWFTRHPSVRWIDPVPVLCEHLDRSVVDKMLARGRG